MSAESPVAILFDENGNPIGVSTIGPDKALKVDVVQSVGGSGGTNSSFGVVFPANGTAAGFNDGTNMQGSRVFDLDSGVGTQYVLGVNLRATGSGGSVEIGTSSNPIRIDPTGATTQPISGTVTISGTTTISGTVTANIGTTNGLALDSTLTKLTIAQSTSLGSNTQVLIGGSVTTSAPTYTTGNINPLSLTTSGALRIDGSGTTQPISGTITANQGTPAIVGNAWPVKISDGVDTAGISTVSGNKALKVDVIQSVGGSGGTSSSFGASFPASGTASGFSDGTNMQGARVFDTDSGAGTEYVIGVNLRGSNSGGSFELGTFTNPIRIDPTGATTQPISGTVTANAGSGTFTISGTVTANIGTTGGLALDTTVSGLQVSQGSTTSGQKGDLILGAVTTAAPSYTTAQTNPLSLTTSGLLRVDGSGVTQPVSGTVTANQGGTWTVQQGTTSSGSSSPWSVELSDGASFYTAAKNTQFPSALVGGRLDTNIGSWLGSTAPTVGQKTSANSVPIVIASDQSSIPVTISSGIDRTSTGTITSTQDVSVNTQASGTCGVQITGSWTGTVVFESTVDAGTTWNSVNAEVPTTGVQVTSATANGNWVIACAGFEQIRVRGNTVATGTATIFLNSSTATQVVILGDPLPTGSNVIGAVTQSGGPWSVSGTVTANQGGAPWTVTGTFADNSSNSTAKISVIAAKANTSAPSWTDGNQAPLSVIAGTGALRSDVSSWLGSTSPTVGAKTSANSIPVVIASDQSTVSINGTVTANIGTTGGLALDTSVNGILLTQGSTTSGEKGPLIQGAVTTSAPTYTTGQTNPLSLDTSGNLRITGTVTTNKAANSSVTAVVGSTSNTTILSSNANRIFAALYNAANKTMFVKLGTVASTSSYTIQLFAGSYWEVPNDYTGEIDAVWAAGVSGNVLVTELS